MVSAANTVSFATNLVVVGGALGAPAVSMQLIELFAATVFIAGALVGMGGLFITQRVNTPPQTVIARESLKKPLLVARAENVEGTEAVGIRNNINNYHPVA